MADEHESTALEPQDSLARLQQSHLDTKLLGQAVIELNIARKNYSIYPSGHVQLARSVDRAYQVLKRLMGPIPQVTLGVARDSLFIGESYLDQRNAVFRDFALALYVRDVAAITFREALTRDDVLSLCRVLGRDAEEIREAGGLQQVMRVEPMAGIELRAIDYSGLHFTEEEEVSAGAAGEAAKHGGHLWRSFVSALVYGHLDTDGTPVSLMKRQKLDPRHLAEMLNDGILNLRAAIQSYEETIAKYLRETTGDQPLEKLVTLIRNLTPTLRGQFLSVTFEHVAAGGRDEVLGSFPDDLALEMLQKANSEGKEISPTLMNLLDRISRIETAAPSPRGSAAGGASSRDLGGRLSRDQMAALFDRESYESFVDSNYRDLLKDLITSTSSQVATGGAPQAMELPGEGHPYPRSGAEKGRGGGPNEDVASLDGRHVNLRLARMMVAMLNGPVEADEYRCFSREVTANIPEFLAYGEFDLCLEILRMFKTHEREKDGFFTEAARESLAVLRSERVANAAAEALDECAPETLERAVSFVSELGASCNPRMLELFAQDEYPSNRKSVFDLLTNAGKQAAGEACTRFQGAPVHVVRNLLLLVQRIGGRDSFPYIRTLTNHENVLVRMDALATLLELKDPDVSIYLRRALHSIDDEESSRGIALAGFYRDSDVLDDLVGMMKAFPFTKSGYRRNAEVIRSLGQIGDVRAIPALEKLAAQRLSLYPRRLRRMQQALFESLVGYPVEHLGELIKAGGRFRDGRIRILMERLSRNEEAHIRTERTGIGDSPVGSRLSFGRTGNPGP